MRLFQNLMYSVHYSPLFTPKKNYNHTNQKLQIANTMNQSTMVLIINGNEREAPSPLTLSALIEQLGMKPERVAVELNRNIIPRERWPETQLVNGDRLEIVHFVGGGCWPRRRLMASS